MAYNPTAQTPWVRPSSPQGYGREFCRWHPPPPPPPSPHQHADAKCGGAPSPPPHASMQMRNAAALTTRMAAAAAACMRLSRARGLWAAPAPFRASPDQPNCIRAALSQLPTPSSRCGHLLLARLQSSHTSACSPMSRTAEQAQRPPHPDPSSEEAARPRIAQGALATASCLLSLPHPSCRPLFPNRSHRGKPPAWHGRRGARRPVLPAAPARVLWSTWGVLCGRVPLAWGAHAAAAAPPRPPRVSPTAASPRRVHHRAPVVHLRAGATPRRCLAELQGSAPAPSAGTGAWPGRAHAAAGARRLPPPLQLTTLRRTPFSLLIGWSPCPQSTPRSTPAERPRGIDDRGAQDAHAAGLDAEAGPRGGGGRRPFHQRLGGLQPNGLGAFSGPKCGGTLGRLATWAGPPTDGYKRCATARRLELSSGGSLPTLCMEMTAGTATVRQGSKREARRERGSGFTTGGAI
eukprot:355690-Chlamydomonas_euryale.AAC.3